MRCSADAFMAPQLGGLSLPHGIDRMAQRQLDGQLLILRGDKTYTVTGTIVK